MDRLAALLEGPRARGAFVLHGSFCSPWSIRIEDEAPLTLIAALDGSSWITSDSGSTHELSAPDVAVLRGRVPYVIGDDPNGALQAVIGPGEVCRAPGGGPSTVMGPRGVRSWGNSPHGPTRMLIGTYLTSSEVSRSLVSSLPDVLVLPDWSHPLLDYVVQEAARDEPGQDAVLDRLLDLLLIAVLRTWFEQPAADTPGWYRAHDDPIVGRALDLIHARPAQPWSLESLAAACGTSRAAFARRFRAQVGESPMAYLADWRLGLAADLLAGTTQTLEAVARQVGYANAFALSTAFKRVRGVSPRDHRRAAAG